MSKKKKTIVGCIYKHPNALVGEFTNDVLEPLLEKLYLEEKELILMGDFNINFLNCNVDKNTSDYMNILCFHAFFSSNKLSKENYSLLKNFN